MSFSFEAAGSQINGSRDYQEDAFLITHLGDPRGGDSASLVVVADGMGGHAAGNVASNMAVQSFNKHLTSRYPDPNLSQILRESVTQANQSIALTIQETPALRGMGCTFVAALLSSAGLRWISVGDSHLYLLRDGQLLKKNADHSYGGFLDRMAATGQTVEPEPGYTRNMLLSAVSGDTIPEIDCPDAALTLRSGDRVIIATDGLDTLGSEEILACSARSVSPRDCIEALLRSVAEAGVRRQDNTTIVVVDVSAKEVPKPSAPLPAAGTGAIRPTVALPGRTPGVRISVARRPARTGYGAGITTALGILVVAAGLIWAGQIPLHRTSGMEHAPSTSAQPAVTAGAMAVAQSEAITPTPESGATAPPDPSPRPSAFRDALKSGGQGPEMLWIPPGAFRMGNPRPGADYDEQPLHSVQVPRFAISRYEVTVRDYAMFAAATGRRPPNKPSAERADEPIAMVSWEDALQYTHWLSQQSGQRYRLPTEAEWEYAAGAGAVTPYWWGFQIGESKALCHGCGMRQPPGKPIRVGSFKPNRFGLFDTAGNVMEWVQDCYHGSYEGAPADGTSWENSICPLRVARGGAFSSPSKSLRTTKRTKFRPDRGYDDVGIRVVREG